MSSSPNRDRDPPIRELVDPAAAVSKRALSPEPKFDGSRKRLRSVVPRNHSGPSQPSDESAAAFNIRITGAYYLSSQKEDCSNWTCVEGEWRPPSPVSSDPLAPEYYNEMAELYLKAAHRLPIAELPFLARCIEVNGLAIGLANPVTNIILNTIHAFAISPLWLQSVNYSGTVMQVLQKINKKSTFFEIASRSHEGHIDFMLAYFLHLNHHQAEQILLHTTHDLDLAIRLIEHGLQGHDTVVSMSPGASRTQTALKLAFYSALTPSLEHSVQLWTSRYPRHLLDPVVEDLRGENEFSVDCIYKVCNLLRHPWSPPPPTPTVSPGTFQDSFGNVITVVSMGKHYATTTISKDLTAKTTITPNCSSRDDFVEGDDAGYLLESAPEERSSIGCSEISWIKSPDFLSFVKVSLLDTIHFLYMEALATLPSHILHEGHLIRAILAAGYCYGYLDPVSNIKLNSIWYDVVCPLAKDVSDKVGASDILDARSLSRIGYRSLDGLVALLRNALTISEQDAVVLLCKCRCDLTSMLVQDEGRDLQQYYVAGATAVKHPQLAAFLAFLRSLTPKKLEWIRSLLMDIHPGNEHSDDQIKQLKVMLSQATVDIVEHVERMAPDPRQSASEILFARRTAFKHSHATIRTLLEKLLLEYWQEAPLEPKYKLGVICGLVRSRHYRNTNCYHINFLASRNGGSRRDTLFFAEFWDNRNNGMKESKKPPYCCPIQDNHDYLGRCFVCESASCRIVHPQSDKYFMCPTGRSFPVHNEFGVDLGEMFESDFIYQDSSPHLSEPQNPTRIKEY